MPTSFDLTEAAANLGRVAQDVFAMMAGMELSPTERAMEDDRYTAVLLFRAPVRAALLMECELKAAAVLTRRMFSLEKVPIGFNADVRDCLGEMVNMIGGNLRNFFPELEALDMTPAVIAGGPDNVGNSDAAVSTFDTGAGCVRISLR